MNKYIPKILIVIGSLTLSLIVSTSVFAEYPTLKDCANATWTTPVGCDALMDKYYAGYYSNGYDYVATTHQNSYNNQPNQYYNNPQVAYQPAQAPIVNNYYYKDESVKTSSTVATTTKTSGTVKSNTQAKTNTNTKANTSSSNVRSDSNNASSEDVFSTDSNGLTALSFRGSGGFLPSSFWQWLIVVFLILAIVILARMISRSHRNDIHGAPAH